MGKRTAIQKDPAIRLRSRPGLTLSDGGGLFWLAFPAKTWGAAWLLGPVLGVRPQWGSAPARAPPVISARI